MSSWSLLIWKNVVNMWQWFVLTLAFSGSENSFTPFKCISAWPHGSTGIIAPKKRWRQIVIWSAQPPFGGGQGHIVTTLNTSVNAIALSIYIQHLLNTYQSQSSTNESKFDARYRQSVHTMLCMNAPKERRSLNMRLSYYIGTPLNKEENLGL